MKKSIAMLLILAFCLAAVFGCTPAAQDPSTDGEEPTAPVSDATEPPEEGGDENTAVEKLTLYFVPSREPDEIVTVTEPLKELLVEVMDFTPDGAQADAWVQSDTLTIGKDLRGGTTSGTTELLVTETGFGGRDAGEITFSLTDAEGNPWSQSGLTWAFLGLPDESTVGGSNPQLAPAGGTLEAGGLVNATLLVAPDGAELADGSYPAWLTVTVGQGSAGSLRGGDGLWTVSSDGSATWRKPITILVDRTPPVEPTVTAAQNQGDGTTLVTGTALPGQLVGVVLTSDADSIGKVEGAAVMAGATVADETTGKFSLTVSTPADGQLLVPFAASDTGTLSLAPAAEVEEPAEQGMWGIFAVFMATMVVCTVTALAILTSGVYDLGTAEKLMVQGRVPQTMLGAPLTAAAFSSVLGPLGRGVVAVSLTLFAFTSLLGAGYYGQRGVESLAPGRGWQRAYRLIFLGVIVAGALGGTPAVWQLADLCNGLMALPNLAALLLLSGQALPLIRVWVEENKCKV